MRTGILVVDAGRNVLLPTRPPHKMLGKPIMRGMI